MTIMTISEARAGLAEVIDQVRISGEPVYLTRRNKPVAALVDIRWLNELQAARNDTTESQLERQAELDGRLADMAALFAPIQSWFDPTIPFPESASSLYAARETNPSDVA